jgi:hypothetical protein
VRNVAPCIFQVGSTIPILNERRLYKSSALIKLKVKYHGFLSSPITTTTSPHNYKTPEATHKFESLVGSKVLSGELYYQLKT